MTCKHFFLIYSQTNYTYSMKRNTLNDIDLRPCQRLLKRNKSWQYPRDILDNTASYKSKFSDWFICTKTIVDVCLQEIVRKAERKFQQIDQCKRISLSINSSGILYKFIELFHNPLHEAAQKIIIGYVGDHEPKQSHGDLLCGGGIAVQQLKQTEHRRTSMLSTIGQSEKEKKGGNFVFRTNDSKCTIKLSKENALAYKKSLQALTNLNVGGDKTEQLMRNKIMRESPQNKLPQNSRQSKIGFFEKVAPSHQQFNYDYDGTALPLKKGPKCILEKINILNTTYRICVNDAVEKGKQNMRHKLHNLQLKTEAEQLQRSGQNRNSFQTRGNTTSDSMRHLIRVCNDLPIQIDWKDKVYEMLKGNSVRIRELKQIK